MKKNLISFCNSIKNNNLSEDQIKEAIYWLNSCKMFAYSDFRNCVKNLYILLIDFIYFKNQNQLIGYKIKELAQYIIDERESGLEPYRKINKDYMVIISEALDELDLKYLLKQNKFNSIRNKAMSNEELALSNISTYKGLMNVLFKYTEDESYIN